MSAPTGNQDGPALRLEDHWPEIRRVVECGQKSTLHCAIASVDPDGMPHVTPIGTVFLRDDQTGFYFDPHTSALARNVEANPAICLMAVNARPMFWLRSLLGGRFVSPPGVRLYGTVGPRRPATPEELRRIEARMRPTRWTRGHRLIWSSFTHVRDIKFMAFRPVRYPAMMDHLWTRSSSPQGR